MNEKSLKINFIYNSSYQIITILLPLITTPYISRVLGATGIGTYSYAFSVAKYFVLFAMLGLNNYGNRTISAIRDNKEALSKTFWSIYYMQIITSIFASLLYILFVVFYSQNIVSVIMFIYVLSSFFDINWFFFGIEKFKITVTRNFIIKILSILCIFLFVKKETDIYLYCIILVVSIFMSQLMVWPFLLKEVKYVRPSRDDIVVHFRNNLILFIPVIAVSLYKTMDKIMLGALSGMNEVGYYENSEKIIDIPVALIQSLGIVMLPRMSNLIANNRKDEGVRYIKYSLLFSVFLSSALSFGIMALSRDFVPWFYGNSFMACVNIFIVLTPSTIFMALANVVRTQFLIPMHRDKIYVISVFVGAFMNIIINALLIPKYMSVGAAIGTLVAEAVVCIYQVVKIKDEIKIMKTIVQATPFAIIGLIMGVMLINWNLTIANTFLLLLVKCICGGLFYITLSFIYFKMIKNKLET